MLRVLTLSTLYPDASRPNFGGFVARQTLGLAARPGVEVRVVAPIGVPPPPLSLHPRYRRFAQLPKSEVQDGILVHRPRFRIWPGIAPAKRPAALARAILPLLRRMTAEWPFDVIDAEFFFPDGPAAVRLGRALGVPVSIKARGSDIHLWGARPACAEALRQAAGGAAGLLAVSEALKGDMVALGMAAERIRVHHTGIDRARFHPGDRDGLKAKLGVAGPLVAGVGTLMAAKGHRLTLEAVAALPGVTLMLAGDGPDRSWLARRAEALGMADRVRLLGSVPPAVVAELMQAADVMALPSAAEGLANAWVEALACDTPIVIANAGGAREIVGRPEAGRIVARDPAAVRHALAELLRDPPAPAAVAATVERFSWERNAAELEGHLRALVRR